MKLVLMSDLHLEFHQDGGASFCEEILWKTPTCDVIALAGDIGQLDVSYWQIKNFISKLSKKAETIIYVPGNHEFYRSSLPSGLKRLEDLANEFIRHINVFISNTPYCCFSYGDWTFHFGTLWFPNLMPDAFTKGCMADFKYIKRFEEDVYRYNNEFVTCLKEFFVPPDKNIVITHHLPSYQCVTPKYRGSHLNQFFANDLDDLILELKPKVWIFGHSHDPVDILVGESRMVSNPAGYPNEIKADWQPKIIEID